MNKIKLPYKDFEKQFSEIFFCERKIIKLESPSTRHFNWKPPQKEDFEISTRDLIEWVEQLRKILLHKIGIRGTTIEFATKDKEFGIICSKVVDACYEDDYGSIAHYEIDPRNEEISQKDFIFRLGVTLMKSIEWAFSQAIFGPGVIHAISSNNSRNDDVTNKIFHQISTESLKKVKGINETLFPMIIIFQKLNNKQREKANYLVNQCINGIKTPGVYMKKYLAMGGDSELIFQNQLISTFLEGKHLVKMELQDHPAQYIKITKSNIINLLNDFKNSQAHYNFFLFSLQKYNLEHNNRISDAFMDTIKWYLMMQVFPKVLYALFELAKDNKIIFDSQFFTQKREKEIDDEIKLFEKYNL